MIECSQQINTAQATKSNRSERSIIDPLTDSALS
jgi:hypothetical protein